VAGHAAIMMAVGADAVLVHSSWATRGKTFKFCVSDADVLLTKRIREARVIVAQMHVLRS
jgi:hypothetical protein